MQPERFSQFLASLRSSAEFGEGAQLDCTKYNLGRPETHRNLHDVLARLFRYSRVLLASDERDGWAARQSYSSLRGNY